MTDPPTSPPPQAESQNAVEDVGEQRIQGTLLSQCPSPTPEEEKTWFEKLFEVQASDNRFEEGQCTWYVYDQRPDVKDWIPDSGAYAHTWDNSASSSNLSVDHNPREGDIAVWEQSCGGPYSKSGHVAYVTKVFEKNDEQWIEVNEYNWNGDLERHEGSEYRVREENCMKFIHEPSNNSQNAEEQVNNQAGSDKKSLLQRIKDWFDNLFK